MLYNCMNKDAFLATGIGFLLGIIITSLILFGPKLTSHFPKLTLPTFNFALNFPLFNKKSNNKPIGSKPSNTPTSLTVSSPLPDTLAESDTILVSGTAPVDATVIIGGELDEEIVHTTANGSYAGKVTLREGKNSLLITSIQGSEQSEQAINVYYTPEKF
jgi:hypothetical protein